MLCRVTCEQGTGTVKEFGSFPSLGNWFPFLNFDRFQLAFFREILLLLLNSWLIREKLHIGIIYEFTTIRIVINSCGAGEMAQCLGVLTVLAEDMNSVPSTHIGRLTLPGTSTQRAQCLLLAPRTHRQAYE